ncbi:MAG TPA: LacI family DNA-binding transcriptional regulator [Capillimicrobium sp.]|jgi:LacI family transcriptional regulator
MKEVAERAGVAMSSVSRVLSEHPDVSERMRTRVMEAVEDLGYVPDMLAQGLRRQKTFSVGFAVSDVANPVLADAITGAESRLRGDGYSLLLTNSEGQSALDPAHIQLLEQRRVDGLLLSLTDEHDPETVRALQRTKLPMVLIDRDVPGGVDARSVSFDHRVGMGEAARHLLELGHRDVALILGGPGRPVRERRAAIESTIRDGGGTCRVYEGPFTVEYGARATREVLASDDRPTAIVAGGNLPMRGALRALRDAGLRLGRDISFIGSDDVAVAEFHDPPIAVVRRDTRLIGTTAAELLLTDLVEGAVDPATLATVLPTAFVPRPSCGPPPGA